jgi:hypothetical protein
VAKLKAQLDEWESDLAQLRDKASDASDDVKEQVDHQIAELKLKRDELTVRRDRIAEAADDKWEAVKDEAEETWTKVEVGLKHSIDRIKSMFS